MAHSSDITPLIEPSFLYKIGPHAPEYINVVVYTNRHVPGALIISMKAKSEFGVFTPVEKLTVRFEHSDEDAVITFADITGGYDTEQDDGFKLLDDSVKREISVHHKEAQECFRAMIDNLIHFL